MGVRVRDLRHATKDLRVQITSDVEINIKYRPLAITPQEGDAYSAKVEGKKYNEALYDWMEATIDWWDLVDVTVQRDNEGMPVLDEGGHPIPLIGFDGKEVEEMVPIKANSLNVDVPRKVLEEIFDAVTKELYPNRKSSETSDAS